MQIISIDKIRPDEESGSPVIDHKCVDLSGSYSTHIIK